MIAAQASDLPMLDRPRAGLVAIVREIEGALAEKRGFSLVRLGDGEGAMLAHAEPRMADELDFSLSIWFGKQLLRVDERARLAGDLAAAIAGADVLGLPRPAQLAVSMRYHEVFPHVARIVGENRPILGDAALHFYLQWSGALGRIAGKAERVTLIGCRDVALRFALHIGVPVRQWLVRGEAQFPGPVEGSHWPEGFAGIMARMGEIKPGDLVLVGAGVLGKAYCEAIRLRGGVALDLGSVFDGWAGVLSRGARITLAPEYSIAHLASTPRDDEAMRNWLSRYLQGTDIHDATI